MARFNAEWKADLQKLKGRTVTGYATGAIGGRLVSLLLTLDDGTFVDLGVEREAGSSLAYIDFQPGGGS